MQKLDADTDGRFEMFDMNNLMIPSHLTSYFQLGWVGFHVGRLIFCFAVDDIFGSAYEITEQEYVDAQNEISNLPSEYDAEYDEERDVTVYHMNYGKSIVYSIVNKSKQMLVLEKYSDSALPWMINCYFKQDGKFYKLSLSDCKELPTKEWLSQFTMIKARS